MDVPDILFNPWLRTVCGLALIGAIFLGAMATVWFERKLSGDIQSRIGPKYVGPIGIFQLVADAIKLLTKEDLIP
ncbi:MAG: NADH-quinone oxidoreductase subunit H, partial [Euryarchaeota archaeon]|nr:NADH-quinone oxidoreductase subunit H [Euryarchaeota archaeon]